MQKIFEEAYNKLVSAYASNAYTLAKTESSEKWYTAVCRDGAELNGFCYGLWKADCITYTEFSNLHIGEKAIAAKLADLYREAEIENLQLSIYLRNWFNIYVSRETYRKEW